jgi:hypothetical protein
MQIDNPLCFELIKVSPPPEEILLETVLWQQPEKVS